MQVPVQIPAVWVQTTSDPYNTFRAEGYPNFLTNEQSARVERIRQSRLLFDGKHREYYLTENRTQFDFARSVAGSRPIQPYVKYNVMQLVSNKGTDLLLKEKPLIRADDPYQQKSLEALADRCMLHPLFYGAALSCSYEAEAFLEACIFNGEACLRQVPSEEIFPVGVIQPNGQYASYCRYSLKNIGTEKVPIYLLREITYFIGKITRRAWQLDEKGHKTQEVSLAIWMNAADSPSPSWQNAVIGTDTGPIGVADYASNLPDTPNDIDPIPDQQLQPVTMTGIDQNTIIWIPNVVSRGQPVSDYDCAIELQDALNAKNTQLANILAKHADPPVAFPQEAADDQGNMRAANKAMFYDDPDRIAKYITWDGECEAALKDRDFALTSQIVVMESSPVLLGIKSEGVKAIAYKSIKLMGLNAIAKADRKAIFWTAGIRLALMVAQKLECAVVPGVRFDTGPISVEFQNGIPNDSMDVATEIATLRGCKSMSQERSIRILIPDPAAADAEIQQMKDEAAEATPSTFFGASTPDTDSLATAGDNAPTAPKGDDEDAEEEVEIE
jgi:hypothetical protein